MNGGILQLLMMSVKHEYSAGGGVAPQGFVHDDGFHSNYPFANVVAQKATRPLLQLPLKGLFQWRLQQLYIFHPYRATSIGYQIELNEIWLLPLFQVEWDFIRSPIVRSFHSVVQATREELAPPGQAAPHFQIGFPLQFLGLKLCPIGQHTSLCTRIGNLKQTDCLWCSHIQTPGFVIYGDGFLVYCGIRCAECTQFQLGAGRLRSPEQRFEFFKHDCLLNTVDMVRHDDEFIQSSVWEMCGMSCQYFPAIRPASFKTISPSEISPNRHPRP